MNESLIFYHFGDKQKLRWTVLEDVRISSHITDLIQQRLRSGLPEEKLFTSLAEDFLHLLEQDDKLLRLLLAPDLREGGSRVLITRFYRKHIVKSYDLLGSYVRKRIREGAFRRVDPQLAARAFISLVCYHMIIQTFFGGHYIHAFSHRKVAQTLAQIWLFGVRA